MKYALLLLIAVVIACWHPAAIAQNTLPTSSAKTGDPSIKRGAVVQLKARTELKAQDRIPQLTQSNSPGLEVVAHAPVISSVTPNPVTGVALPGRVNLTLRGANYVIKPAISLTWTGGSKTLTSSSVTFVSSNRVDIAVVTNVTPDKWTVVATNPDGQKSNAITFRVAAPASANISTVPNGSSDAKDKSVVAEHLVKDSDGMWRPAPGYVWRNPNDDKDKNVVQEHLVQGPDGLWTPAPGYDWASPNDAKDKRVIKMKPSTERISSISSLAEPTSPKFWDKHGDEILRAAIKLSGQLQSAGDRMSSIYESAKPELTKLWDKHGDEIISAGIGYGFYLLQH